MKTLSKKFLAIAVVSLLVAASALAQNVQRGAAPGTPQDKILNGAISAETRNTLQQAMDSVDETPAVQAGAPATASATKLDIAPGEAAEIADGKVTKVPIESVPAQLKNALSGYNHSVLTGDK